MLTATRIIPRPPAISKFLNASIVLLLCDFVSRSALRPRLHRDRLPGHLSRCEKQAEHLPENQFLRQQSYRQRKHHPCHHCHECDCHLHKSSLKNLITNHKPLPLIYCPDPCSVPASATSSYSPN